MDAECIERAVNASTFWRDLVYLGQTSSTNDVAKDLAAHGAPEGAVVVAEEQTAGRGRLNRRWIAPPRTSLLCSFLFRPNLRPVQTNRLTMLCSMAAADTVQNLCGLSVALKWPNDLIVATRDPAQATPNWRKLAGVLTEMGLSSGDLSFAIVGIGVNVNVPAEELTALAPDATSILTETGLETDRSELLVRLLEHVEMRYERLRMGENPCQEWSSRLATLDQRVRVTTSDGVLRGMAEAVDEDGALLLRADDDSLHRLLTADVTLAEA
ncbi:MAG: biotin--[acetyl-CoA-carboxylase] ligase [Anaerolineae bacterium]